MSIYPLDGDMESSARAQSFLVAGGLSAPDKITAIIGSRHESAQDHITQLGLTRIETDDTEE